MVNAIGAAVNLNAGFMINGGSLLRLTGLVRIVEQ